MPSCVRYLATVRRAMRIPCSSRRDTISLSVIGRPSFVTISFNTSFMESDAVKKSLKGITRLSGRSKYLSAVALLMVLSCNPRYWPLRA